jgi:hypothetical protein
VPRTSPRDTLGVIRVDRLLVHPPPEREPVVGAVAEELLDLRADVDDVAVLAREIGRERKPLDQIPVAALCRHHLLLGPDGVRDVPQRPREDAVALALDSRDRQLGRDRRAVLAQRRQPQPPAHDPALAGPCRTSQALLVPGAKLLRHDQVAQPAPDRLFARPAERPLGRAVPFQHEALVVHHEDAVQRGLEDRLLVLGQARRALRGRSQLHAGGDGAGERAQDLELLARPLAPLDVEHREHPVRDAGCVAAGHAGVGHAAQLGQELPTGEGLRLADVREDERLVAAAHRRGELSEVVAARPRGTEADVAREPEVGLEEHDERDRHVQRKRRQAREPAEILVLELGGESGHPPPHRHTWVANEEHCLTGTRVLV